MPKKNLPPKRQCIAPYDKEKLKTGLQQYVENKGTENALNLGAYQQLRRSQAVNAFGLVAVQGLLVPILTACPGAELHIKFLRDVIEGLCLKHPKICGGMSLQHYTGWLCERLLTILNHLRRLKLAPKKYQEATRHLNQRDKSSLDSLLALVQLPGAAAGRVLQPNLSEVTLDSDGWPKDLDGEGSAGDGSDQEPGSEEARGAEEGGEVREDEPVACSKKPASKAVKKKPAGKRPASRLYFEDYMAMTPEAKKLSRPNGCPKCREKVGCCPSCFPKKK